MTGGLALYAAFQIGLRLYNRQAAFVCAALYVICPFTLLYDRMALADGPLSAFAALILLWAIALGARAEGFVCMAISGIHGRSRLF
jgi:4-amino-4-deoxy-L-arabinose transferase-like glycosyltransferase